MNEILISGSICCCWEYFVKVALIGLYDRIVSFIFIRDSANIYSNVVSVILVMKIWPNSTVGKLGIMLQFFFVNLQESLSWIV